jgi:hypothetical protein
MLCKWCVLLYILPHALRWVACMLLVSLQWVYTDANVGAPCGDARDAVHSVLLLCCCAAGRAALWSSTCRRWESGEVVVVACRTVASRQQDSTGPLVWGRGEGMGCVVVLLL